MGLPPITPAPRRFLLQSSQTPKPTSAPGHALSSSQFPATTRFAGTPKFSSGSLSTIERKGREEEIEVEEGEGEDEDEVHDDEGEAEHEEQAGALASDEREIMSPSLPRKSPVPESLKPIPVRRPKREEIEESALSPEDALQQPHPRTNKDNHPSTPPQPPSSKRRCTFPPPPHLAANLEAIQISSSPSVSPTPITPPPGDTAPAELSDGRRSPPQDEIYTPSKHHHTSHSRPSFIFSQPPPPPPPPLGNPTDHPTPLIDSPRTTNPPPATTTTNLPPLPTRRPAYILPPAAPPSPTSPSSIHNSHLSKMQALLLSPHKSKSGKDIKYAAGGLASTVRGWVLDLTATDSADIRGRGYPSMRGKGMERTAEGKSEGKERWRDEKEHWAARVKVKEVRPVGGFGGGGGGGGKGWFVDAEEEDGYEHDHAGTYKERRKWFLVGNGVGVKKGERVQRGDIIGIGGLNWEVRMGERKKQMGKRGEHAEEPITTPAISNAVVNDNLGEEAADEEDLAFLTEREQSRSNEGAGEEKERKENEENGETWRVVIEWKVLFSQPSSGIG